MNRCARCNALLEENELVTIRERLVTRHRYNSGRTYKVSAFPRYHIDLAKCDAIYGVKSHPDDLREAALLLGSQHA